MHNAQPNDYHIKLHESCNNEIRNRHCNLKHLPEHSPLHQDPLLNTSNSQQRGLPEQTDPIYFRQDILQITPRGSFSFKILKYLK